MIFFEGRIEYKTITEGFNEKKRISFSSIIVKDTLVKVIFKDKNSSISDEYIYNPNELLSYHIDHTNKTLILRKMSITPNSLLSDYPLRKKIKKYLCLGKSKIQVTTNKRISRSEYLIDSIPLNVKYPARYIRYFKSHSKNGVSKIVHHSRTIRKYKNNSIITTVELVKIDATPIDNLLFKVDSKIKQSYRVISEEQDRIEAQLIRDGFYKEDAITILKRNFNRELSKKEKLYPLQYLALLLKGKPLLKKKLIQEINEKERLYQEKFSQCLISILEKEWRRSLTKVEKLNPHKFYIAELKKSVDKSIRLSKELFKLLK